MQTKTVLKIWLQSVYFEKITYQPEERPITALQTPDHVLSLIWFIEVNFSKLTNKIKFS